MKNPQIIKEFLNNKLIYSIEGESIKVSILRELKNFIEYRRKLRKNWPGFIIPIIPDISKEQKNVSTDLNFFCLKLKNIPEIFNSYETKIFFNDIEDVENIIKNINEESNEFIADKYEKLFKEKYDYNFILKEEENKLKSIKIKIENLILAVKKLNRTFLDCLKLKLKEKGFELAFLKVLTYHENQTIKKYANEDETLLLLQSSCKRNLKIFDENEEGEETNFYNKFYLNFFEEEYDIYTFLDAVDSFLDMVNTIKEMQSNLNQIKDRLQEMAASKSNWVSYFNLESPEKEFENLLQKKVYNEFEINNISKICKYSAVFLRKKYESSFIDTFLDRYYTKIKYLANNSIDYADNKNKYFQEMELNLQNIINKANLIKNSQ